MCLVESSPIMSFRFLLLLFTCCSLCADEVPDCVQELLSKEIFQEPVEWISLSGGATNENFCLKAKFLSYFIRLASSDRETLGASWEREETMHQIAAQLEIAPSIIAMDPQKGVFITSFIQGSCVNLRESESLQKIAFKMQRLHQSQKKSPFVSDPESIIQSYLGLIKNLGPRALSLARKRPKVRLDNLVPCHLDLHSGNIIQNGEELMLIDWEYGGMSDPLFDVAILASTECFNDEEMRKLLSCYLPGYTSNDWKRLYDFRILADLRWGLWSLIQKEQSKLNVDYDAMAKLYLDQYESRLMTEL